jgi:hypothetical protein
MDKSPIDDQLWVSIESLLPPLQPWLFSGDGSLARLAGHGLRGMLFQADLELRVSAP